jgi:O-antigen/teichoic acid export membrane protein
VLYSNYTNRLIVLTFNNAITKGSLFILSLALAKIMSKNDFGRYSLFISTLGLLGVLFTFGMSSFINMQATVSPEKRKEYLYSCIILTSGITSILTLIFYLLPIKIEYINIITILGGIIWALVLIKTSYNLATNELSNTLFLSVLQYLFPIILIIVYCMSKQSIIMNFVDVQYCFLTSFIIIFILFYFNVKAIKCKVEKNTFIIILRESLPMLPYILAVWIINISDRYFIEYYLDMSKVGDYSLIYTLSSLYTIITGVINSTYINKMFEDLKNNFSLFKKYILTISGIYLLVFTSSIFLIISIVNLLAFNISLKMFSFIIIGMFCCSLYTIIGNILYFLNYKYLLMFIVCSSATINLALNMLLIPYYNLIGAAFATLIAYFTMLALSLAFFLIIIHRKSPY